MVINTTTLTDNSIYFDYSDGYDNIFTDQLSYTDSYPDIDFGFKMTYHDFISFVS